MRTLLEELTTLQRKEPSVFTMKAIGLDVSVADVKKIVPMNELEELIATGLNLNRHLCASIVDVRRLRIQGTYEVTCIAYRGGTARKTYILEALTGVAFVP